MSEYQDAKMPDGTGYGGHKTFAAMSKNSRERAARENRLTWANVLEEAASAVLAEADAKEIINRLDRLADVALDWQLALMEQITEERLDREDLALAAREAFKRIMENKEQK